MPVGGCSDNEGFLNFFSLIAIGTAIANIAIATCGIIAIGLAIGAYRSAGNSIFYLPRRRLDYQVSRNEDVMVTARAYKRVAMGDSCLRGTVYDCDGNRTCYAYRGSAGTGDGRRRNIMCRTNFAWLQFQIEPVGKSIKNGISENLATFFQGLLEVLHYRFLPVAFDEIQEAIRIEQVGEYLVGNFLEPVESFITKARGAIGFRFGFCCS